MAHIKQHFPIVFQLFLFVISVQCCENRIHNNVGNMDMFSIMNENISSIANEILSQDWTQNLECLNELRQIQIGLKNYEKWSMKSRLKFFEITHKTALSGQIST